MMIEIPGYAEAVEKQNLHRDLAFLGVPEILCGLAVAPLTFRHLLWLQFIGSPFVGAGDYNVKTLHLGVAGFFKTIAPIGKPSFQLTPFDHKEQADLKTFMLAVGKIKAPDALAGIREFVADAFMDAPAGKADKAKGESYFSVGAALTHRLAKQYAGLNPNPAVYPSAVDVPLKAGFQFLKLITRDEAAAAGKRPTLFNALTSTLKSRWLEELNQNPEADEQPNRN
jgi:hypothetical protein